MKFPTRWIKILKDIWSNRSRSILVVISIAVGIAAVGMINNSAHIIKRDLYGKYSEGNPAYLEIYASPFQKNLAESVQGMREVSKVQAKRIIDASVVDENNQWLDFEIYTVPDFSDIRINRFSVEKGSALPGVREVLLERQSAQKLGVLPGDVMTIKMSDDRRYELKVVGIVHDVYIMPFNLLGKATGYVNLETLEWLGEQPFFNRLDIVTNTDKDKSKVLDIGNLIRDRTIEPAGYTVNTVRIPGVGSKPGDHWAQNQIRGFLLILQIMGIMSVFLSAGLIINTVSAMITQQIKQIGIMRSIGADRHQLTSMYLVQLTFLSVLGLLLAIPLGLLGAWGLSNFAAGFLNFNVKQVDLPFQVIALQVFLGLLMPLGVALFPILSGTTLSIYDAIYQYGLTSKERHGRISHLISKAKKLSPPIILSLRNTFRKKARLAFTLTTLTLAGAMFIAAFSTRSSLTSQIRDIGRYFMFDAALDFPGGAGRFAVEREALRIQGITYAEGWATTTGVIIQENGHETGDLEIVGLPYDTKTIDPLLISGSWLNGSATQEVVINQDLIEDSPNLKVEDEITIKVEGKKRNFKIVGIVSKHLSGSRIYMDFRDFEKLTGIQNQVNQVRVISLQGKPSKSAVQDRIAIQLKERFENGMFTVGSSTARHTLLGNFTSVFNIILYILVIMAGLLAIVGGLGLTGALGINVLERTREIGVLRAVGASNFTVRQIVVVEGMVVGFISWVMGAIFSAPSGWALATAVIYAVLRTNARFEYSFPGLAIWFLVVMSIGIFASLAPAMNAARLRVREVLDYE